MSNQVADAVARAQAKRKHDDEQWRAMLARDEESSKRASAARAVILGHCRPCWPCVYAKWLQLFIRAGGEITHPYNYNLPTSFYMVEEDYHLVIPEGLCGALAVELVVPPSSTYEHAGFDHVNVFDMALRTKPSWVPLYNDVAQLLNTPEEESTA